MDETRRVLASWMVWLGLKKELIMDAEMRDLRWRWQWECGWS